MSSTASPENDDRGGNDPAEDERHDDVLVMRVGGVEQVLEREEVDVVQRDQEGGAPAPHEDEDRQDRMCSRRSRLRRLGETRGPSTFRAGSARFLKLTNVDRAEKPEFA